MPALVLDDRIYETSVTTGTGEYTLAGAVTGFQPASVIGADNYLFGFVTDDTNWEAGIYTYVSGPDRLQRTHVVSSSNADAAVNWGAGTKKLRCGWPAFMALPRQVSKSVAGAADVTLTALEQRCHQLILTGALTGNINVIVDTTKWGWEIYNNTSGSFSLTVKTAAGTGVVVPQGTRMLLLCDGTNVAPKFTAASFTTASFSDGTAAAPSVKVGDEQNGLYSPAANVLGLATAGVQRLRLDGSGNAIFGSTETNNVVDAVSGARPLLVQKSDSSTTLGGSGAALVITNGDTTTNNTAQINFAAITGAALPQYSSAVIAAIFGPRTNAQYAIGSLSFLTSTAVNNAPSEKMRLSNVGALTLGTSVGSPASGFDVNGSITLPVDGRIRSRSTFSSWVRHDAAGAIVRNLHIGSVTKNSTGNYTANISAGNLADGSYGFLGMSTTANVVGQDTATAPTATAFRYQCVLSNTAGATDTGALTVGFLP